MRLEGILFATLIVAGLTLSCGSIDFKPMFDMSTWTTDTYPAFIDGSLSDARSPAFPSPSSSGADLQHIEYKPIFDMSPGAFSFDTFPVFSSSGGGGSGIIFGMMMGTMSRGG